MAAKDSILNTICGATNDASRETRCAVIPVNWAEIARALRSGLAAVHLRPRWRWAATDDFNMRGADFDGHLDRQAAMWGWHGPSRAASGGADSLAAPVRARPPYLSHAEGILLPA